MTVGMLSSSWYTSRRLQTQLLLWTAVILIVSVVGTMELRVRSNVQLLEGNLRDRSETTLRSLKQLVDLVGANAATPTTSLEPELRERVAADRTLVRLDVIRRTGAAVGIAASSSAMSDILVRTFGKSPVTEVQERDGQRVMVTSQAADNPDYGLVAVASMENIDRYASANRR